jgi:hypothetical protein
MNPEDQQKYTQLSQAVENLNMEKIAVSPESLQLVYEESQKAFQEIMTEIRTFSASARHDLQINLVLTSIVLVFVSSDFASTLWSGTRILVFVLALLLFWSTYIISRTLHQEEYYRGNIEPYVLQQEKLEISAEQTKADIIELLARNYRHNDRQLNKHARQIDKAHRVRLVAMICLMVIPFGVEIAANLVR